MPLLDETGLAALRRQQESAVQNHCPNCTAHTWPNYCRQCDEFFTDGHLNVCPEATLHQKENHRRYRLKQILCPKCGGDIDAMIVSPWDDLSMPSSIDAAPYVCSWCASLLIVVFTNDGPTLLEPDEETIVAIQSDQALWQAITTEQARILALRNRQKVRTQ